GRRYSYSLGAELLATAVPVLEDGRVAGAVRITQSVAAVHHAVRRIIVEVVALGALVLLLGLGAGALIARQLTRPIVRLEGAARGRPDGPDRRRAARPLPRRRA